MSKIDFDGFGTWICNICILYVTVSQFEFLHFHLQYLRIFFLRHPITHTNIYIQPVFLIAGPSGVKCSCGFCGKETSHVGIIARPTMTRGWIEWCPISLIFLGETTCLTQRLHITYTNPIIWSNRVFGSRITRLDACLRKVATVFG